MVPVVAGMHAKVHAWWCQVRSLIEHTYQVNFIDFAMKVLHGPVWKPGVGTEFGEYMELTNAHLHRYGPSTKHMEEGRKHNLVIKFRII